MNGEIILRVLVIVLFFPAVGAVLAYFGGHLALAMGLNGVLPFLVFAGSALAMLTNPPTNVSVTGAMYFAVPLAALVASVVGLRQRRLHPALFWCTWAANVAIVAFLFYLSFLFRISF